LNNKKILLETRRNYIKFDSLSLFDILLIAVSFGYGGIYIPTSYFKKILKIQSQYKHLISIINLDNEIRVSLINSKNSEFLINYYSLCALWSKTYKI
jgi:hypothetical protein